MIKFSIIVPVYKVENYLNRCLDSILEQTYKNYEVILIDDGSPDKSGEICDEYERKYTCFKTLHQRNQGLSTARNNGSDKATGDYIIFLDSDDYWCNKYLLETAANQIEEIAPDIILFPSKKIVGEQFVKIFNGTTKRERLSKDKSAEQLIKDGYFKACAWDKIIKKTYIQGLGLRFQRNRLSEDQVWCMHLLVHNPKIDVIDEPSHCYFKREGSITTTPNKKYFEDVLQNFEDVKKYLSENNNSSYILNVVNAYMAFEYMALLNTFRIKDNVLKKQINKYSYVLKYSKRPLIKGCYYFKKIFGLSLTLSLIHKIKNV